MATRIGWSRDIKISLYDFQRHLPGRLYRLCYAQDSSQVMDSFSQINSAATSFAVQ
jgi:hypothetical protein